MGDVDARVHVDTTTALGRARVLVLRSAAFIPEENVLYWFYRRLNGPQDQSGHEGANKNLHPSDKFQSKYTHIVQYNILS